MLKNGGNAADAAVAAAAALAVVDPYMAGLGGFGYALFYDAAEDRVHGVDYVGSAPREAKIELYTREKPWEDYKPTAEGMLSVLVPGVVAGWMEVLERLGTMKLGTVLEPAIELARGYHVSGPIHRFYESIKSIAGTIPSNASAFYRGGRFPRPGKVLSQPSLARTLGELASDGRAFYEGSIAKRIVAAVRERGGILSEEDLAVYRAAATEPVSGTFESYRLYSHRPGSSGMTILQWLNILEGLDLPRSHDDEKYMHLFLESGKLALRDDDRWNTGKSYAEVPVNRLTSKRYARAQRSKIGERARFYELASQPREYGNLTKHHCTCDARGNMVSMTETQMYGFDRVGVLEGLGFAMNGGACYFSLDPGHIERLEGGERPRYVMSPTIAFAEGRAIALGAAGGWTIPQTITQVLMKVLHFGFGVQRAVTSPRFVLRYRYNSIPYAPGTVIDAEDGIGRSSLTALEKRGHVINKPTALKDYRPGWGYGFGAVNALVRSGGTLEGGAETRRDGYAARV
jgi:gamma-glutamyltranspeptidase/glutathione hydrolase